MENDFKIKLKSAALTILILYFLCVIWQKLEINFYGQIQYRKVDDIMMIIFMPFIYLSAKYIITIIERNYDRKWRK